MSITQDRMQGLLSEAWELDATLEALRKELAQTLQWHREGHEGFTTANALAVHIVNALERHRKPRVERMVIEREHFRKVAKRNDANRLRLFSQRREAGVPQAYGPRPKAQAPWAPEPGGTWDPTAPAPASPPGAASPPGQALPPEWHAKIAEAAKAFDAEQVSSSVKLPQDVEIEGGMGEIPLGTNPKDLL